MSTKAPNGLGIDRNGETFTFHWTKQEKYSQLELKYRQSHEKGEGVKSKWDPWKNAWSSNKANKGKKEFSLKLPVTKDHTKIQFKIKGKKGKSWSKWATSSVFDIKPPKTPKIELTFTSEFSDPACLFTWEVEKDNKAHEWFYRVAWRTRLVDNSTGAVVVPSQEGRDWTDIVYDEHNSSSYMQDGGFVIREDPNVVFQNDKTYKREVQLVAYGPGGPNPKDGFTGPKTASYVYARPKPPVICASSEDEGSGASLVENGRGGLECNVNWASNSSAAFPLDSQEVQYLVCVPAFVNGSLTPPSGEQSFTTAAVYHGSDGGKTFTNKNITTRKQEKSKKKKRWRPAKLVATTQTVEFAAVPSEEVYFTLDYLLQPDYVVFVRIMSKRSTSVLDESSGPVVCAYDYDLTPPEQPVITLNPIGANNRIQITTENKCQITGSMLVVHYLSKTANSPIIDIGVITETGSVTKTIEIPNGQDDYSIGLSAVLLKNSPTPTYNSTGQYTSYSFNENDPIIQSETIWVDGASMPKPPTNVKLNRVSDSVVNVTWDWSWSEADTAELSWSDYKDAWTSTSEPSTYRITNLNEGNWNITGLSLGMEYFVAVRFIKTLEGDKEYASRWSSPIQSIFFSSTPAIPQVEISPSFINPGGKFTVTWVYVSTDNTAQKQAQISLDDTNSTSIATITGVDQSFEVTAPASWVAGTTKPIKVKVQSESELSSEWSEPVTLPIVAPLTSTVTLLRNGVDTGFVNQARTIEVVDDNDQIITETIIGTALRKLPCSIVVTGGSTISLYIERYGHYDQPGPDEKEFVGFDKEIVYSKQQVEGEDDNYNTFVITPNDLIGSLDDGGSYTVRAVVSDEHKQTAENNTDLSHFYVDWDHKTYEPSASVSYVRKAEYSEAEDVNAVNFVSKRPSLYIYNSSQNRYEHVAPNATYNSSTTYYYMEMSDYVGKIDTYAVSQAVTGDILEIYRLSADKPQLIINDGVLTANGSYVDPYPTIGDFGGYRIAFKSKYGDYIKADGYGNSWIDYTYSSESMPAYRPGYSIINFGDDELHLVFNVDLTSSWAKDFTETKYLGGSVQGDWNPAVSRTSTAKAEVTTDDLETIKTIRKLAVYSGACHVRTSDGSNYMANVEVNESVPYQMYSKSYGKDVKLASYDFNITRVDNDDMDGMTYASWIED